MSYIKGLSDLRKSMQAISDTDKALEKSVQKWTEYVRGEAVDLCPVDTGELQQSIRATTEGRGNAVQGIVYTEKEYAAYVEFGTGKRGEASQADTSPDVQVTYSHLIDGQPAQPYMYPALNNNVNRIMKGIREDLQKAMRD